MDYPLRSRFVYTGGDFTTELPSRPWTPGDSTVGGSRTAGSGVPATYVVRRDALLDVPLRIEEGQWVDLRNFIEFGQSGQSFLWYPDADGLTSFSVYLEAPAPGTKWSPGRAGDYQRMLELTITLRDVGGAAPWLAYFA